MQFKSNQNFRNMNKRQFSIHAYSSICTKWQHNYSTTAYMRMMIFLFQELSSLRPLVVSSTSYQ